MQENRLARGSVVAIRIFLAVVALTYGSIKLLGGQFYYGDWTMSKHTVSGTFLVWAFYGYSPFYGRTVGLFELIPGIMLLFRRTATLGALALFAVLLNITVMDFAFGFPSVKYMSLLYTVLAGLLLVYDYKKLRLIFWSGEEVGTLAEEGARRPRAASTTKRASRGAKIAIVCVALPLVLFALNLVGTAVGPGPEPQAETYLLQHGWQRGSFRFVGSSYTGLFGIGRTADIRFQTEGPSSKTVHVLATRANGFVGWKIDGIEDAPAGQ